MPGGFGLTFVMLLGSKSFDVVRLTMGWGVRVGDSWKVGAITQGVFQVRGWGGGPAGVV